MTLGTLLREIRTKRKLTAREVLKKTGLNVSTALLSQWENDKKIPTPENLSALCQSLGLNRKIAFHLWAQAHMPEANLKRIFTLASSDDVEKPAIFPSKEDTAIYPASITKTIQERDIQFFFDNPAAGAILMRALVAGNLGEKPWPIEKLTDGLGLTTAEARKVINLLVEMNYIVEDSEKFQTPKGVKYVFMPENEKFEKLREARIRFNFNRVLNNINLDQIKKGKAFRINLTNKLSKDELEHLIRTLKTASNDFLSTDESKSGQKYYQFIALVGPEYDNQ